MRILLIEDDEILTDVLLESLQQQRYTVDAIDDGRFGLEYADGGSYDLLLVDVGLPRLDGISLCQQLRNNGDTTPILLMTAKDAPDEKIRGLDAGADDYLTKPLDLAELHARLRALLRRGEVSPTTVLEVGQLRLDPVSCEVTYAEAPVKLTPKEYSLLELFLRNPTRVFSRGQIIEHLWTFDDPPLEDSVKAHIKGLRRRLKKAGADGWIENVYGLGYKLSPKIDYEAIAQKPTPTNSSTPAPPTETTTSPQPLSAVHPSPSSSVEQQFQQAMAGLWKQHRGAMAERLNHIETAQSALAQSSLTEDQRVAAAQAAHKLAGVLGMFGQDEGTQIARQLETSLSSSAPVLSEVSPLIQTLTQTIAQADTVLGALSSFSTSTPPTAPAHSTPQHSTAPQRPAPQPAAPARSAQSESVSARILAVDDDPTFLATLPPILEPWGITLTTLSDPTQFWSTLRSTNPDLLMLDIEMPGINGLELCQAIRDGDAAPEGLAEPVASQDAARWQSLPILFLTARQHAAGEVFAAGADDYIVKPVLGPELITRITNRLERIRLLKTLSSRDAQTGLVNQTQSQQDLQAWMAQEKAYTLLLLRLENLAYINLHYGHSMGHYVLKCWGDAIATHVPAALAGYWGNGDFVLGLPEVTEASVEKAIAPLLKAFRQQVFSSATTSQSSNTANRFQAQYALGQAPFPSAGKTLKVLYQKAHAAMASAKS